MYRIIVLTEPTSNIAPKALDKKFGFAIVTARINKTAIAMCQVVGFPVPIYK